MPETAELQPVSSIAPSIRPPLVVDLDGTLVKTDLFLESLVALLKQRPHYIFCVPFWLLKGKANLKRQIARRISLDVSVLPYRDDVLDYLTEQRRQKRSIVLATAADMQIARQVADHLKFFDLVLASDGIANLSAQSKRDRLVREFGERGFDYAGNSRDDLAVWASARRAILVNPGSFVGSRVEGLVPVDRVLIDPERRLVDYVRALRPHHWYKNLLVFAPLLAAHRFDEASLFIKTFFAFLAFGCFASAGYLLNDLLDLSADRHHPRKRNRVFAAGTLPIAHGLVMIPVLLAVGCFFGLLISPAFVGIAAIYFGVSVAYSAYAKTLVLLDVIVLAGLYTLRIIAGSVSVAIWPSPWLLAFSTFLFFSLALVKRHSELAMNHIKAREYELSDQELLASMGVASGYVAVLVLALYINTAVAHSLYRRYEVLWSLCPLLLYWISHIWLNAHRGKMPDDPLVFATRDRTSRILIGLMLAATVIAL